MAGRSYWSKFYGRRAVLRASAVGGAGLAGAALIGCGGDSKTAPTQAANTGAPAAGSKGS